VLPQNRIKGFSGYAETFFRLKALEKALEVTWAIALTQLSYAPLFFVRQNGRKKGRKSSVILKLHCLPIKVHGFTLIYGELGRFLTGLIS
jgi:hypothetical protein